MKRAAVLVVALWLILPRPLSTFRSDDAASTVPRKHWETIERPESVGFSSKRLDAVRAWLSSLDTTAMMVVVGGRTLFTYGMAGRLAVHAQQPQRIIFAGDHTSAMPGWMQGALASAHRLLREIN